MAKQAGPGANRQRWSPIPRAGESRRNSSWRFGAWAWLLALAVIGCDSSPATVRLEVYSWWDALSEKRAFDLVSNLHRTLHPEVAVVNLDDLKAPDARARVAQNALAGAPPATFQANLGTDLLRWTAVDVHGSSERGKNRIYALSRVFARTDLLKWLPDELLQGLRAGPTLEPYAVPINIHRLNVLYYNVARLAELSPPEGHDSWLDISLLCPSDPNAQPLELQIVVGAADKFTLTLLVFENLLPALAGAEFYDRLFRGEMSSVSGVDDGWKDEVRRTLRCAQFLAKSFAPTNPSWTQAVDAVRSGAATLTVMGDWAGGQLSSELEQGKVRAVPFPNSEDIYVFTSDTFPLPVDAEHTAETEALLETIASTEAQRIFSQEKGSIPARGDVVLNEVDAARRADFARATKALATSGRFPPYYNPDDLNDKLLELLRPEAGPETIEAVVEELVSLQPLLKRWQQRLKDGPADIPLP